MLFELLAGKLYLQKAYRMEPPRESMRQTDKQNDYQGGIEPNLKQSIRLSEKS